MATKRDSLSAYSDASSSYWPPGWNFARFASATPADNATLSEEERAKMQAGLRDVMGEEGVAELARIMWQEQLRAMRAEKEKKAVAAPPPPAWLGTWRKRYKDSRKSWGFVCIWTNAAVSAAEESGGAEEFQNRVRELAENPFRAALEQGQPAELIEDARETFEIQWVRLENLEKEKDISDTDLVERLRARYHSTQEPGSVQQGLALPIFLVVSPSAVVSVLSTSGERPEATSPGWRSGAPFLLAVAAEDEQGAVEEDKEVNETAGRREVNSFKPVFRVAVEVLVGELWPAVEEQITTLEKMTTYVQGADVTEHALSTRDDEEHEGAGEDEDGLDAVWWSMHPPPHRMRKRRRLFGSG
ncbi:hypothetical protein BDW74DRAFT_155327 [Aspergillus multicolor]|uniref:uncharacterized protein n=1 Tax=Aspergillus multicolor TaxID=41759 RepID=UPI003CCD3B79